jgi:RimJ/RimL family protein N-acetyltransferase
MRAIPTIRTARLTLRSMRAEDFGRFADIWALCDLRHHVSGRPVDESRAWGAFLRNAGHWQLTGFGHWAVEPHGKRQMMGQAGFGLGRAGLGEDFDAYPEAAWVLHPEVQGQGLATDAAQAAHDWFDRVVTGPVVCKVAPDDTHSLAIAEKLGYVALRTVDLRDLTVQLMFRKTPPGGPRNLLADFATCGNVASARTTG